MEEAGIRIEPIRAIIIDDQPLLALGIHVVLSRFMRATVVGYAKSFRDTRAMSLEAGLDLIFLDAQMVGVDPWAVRELQERAPSAKIVFLCRSGESDLARTTHPEDLVLRESSTRAELVTFIQRLFPRSKNAICPESLSDREIDVARLVAEGCSNRFIARTLFISEHTVKTHLSHIARKLDTSGRLAIARWWASTVALPSDVTVMAIPN